MELTKAEFIRILDDRLEVKLEEKLEQKLNEKLDQKFAIHTAEMKKFVITHVSEKIDELALMVKSGFDNVDVQFSQVNRRLDALEGKSFKHGWAPRYK